jgi:hypothetical protein
MYSSVTTDTGGFAMALGCGDQQRCSEHAGWGAAELAVRPRWAAERTLALPGRCRGTVLARWAENCRRHFGAAALARVRDGLPGWARDLPGDPPDDAWFPVGLQLRVTELVVDECLGGDMLQLEALLHDDIRRALPRATALFIRTLGPGPVLARAKQIHPHLYDVGSASAITETGRAQLSCIGAELFGHPVFALLQMFAHRGFVELTGRRVSSLRASHIADEALTVELRWS